MEIVVGDKTIKYEVQYNAKRKKLAMSVGPTGLVTVKAPKNTPTETVEDMIRQNMGWVDSAHSEMDRRKKALELSKELGVSKCLYLGKPHRPEELLDISDADGGDLKELLKKFYTASARTVILERVEHYKSELKVKPKRVEIMESKTKWGTCSSEKILSFNYRLVMAPVSVIDYVVVHEICHLDHMNHDRSFWRKVGGIMPDYKERQEFLKRYGQFMDIDNMDL